MWGSEMYAFKWLSLTLVAGLFSGPVFAEEQLPENTELIRGGFVGVGVGWTFLNEDNDQDPTTDETGDDSYLALRFEGAFSQPLTRHISAQLDIIGEYFDADQEGGGGPDNQIATGIAGAHISARDAQKGLVGWFGGISQGRTNDIDNENTAIWVGAEAQKYFERVTLYAQAGLAWGDVHSSQEEYNEAGFARLVGRYFVDYDFRLQAEASVFIANDAIDPVDILGSDDVETIGWGLRADKRLGNSRFYGFAKYDGLYIDTTTEQKTLVEHALKVGISRHFGASSLFEQDRSGATLDQPEIITRTTGWMEPLD